MSDSSDKSYIPSSESSDEDNTVQHVKVARSQPRDPATGEICFDVEYKDGTVARVPIRSFMNLEEQFITHDDVSNAVEDWIAVAAKYPYILRKCICCRRRATTGRIMCGFCSKDYGRRLMLSGLTHWRRTIPKIVLVPPGTESCSATCSGRCGK